MRSHRRVRLASVIVAALLAGCASFPVNQPLGRVDPQRGYRFDALARGSGNSDETFVILSLSGGGTRAAALDYGVIRRLGEIRLAGGGTLLDEVDLMTTSSAASLVGAYYAAFGREAFFERFRQDVLELPLQSALLRSLAAPWHWPRLWSRRFSRSDLVAEYLDAKVFHGVTFADLHRIRPLVVMNATDVSTGAQFSFVQSAFDQLCSDLDSFSLARAVTASLAFTGGFTPVTLRNYPDDTCGYRVPSWVVDALVAGPDDDPRNYDDAAKRSSYGLEQREWIHLLDGGISDNIGMRAPRVAFAVRGAPWSVADKIASGVVKRLAVIIVDARQHPDYSPDQRAKAPGMFSAVMASASNPLAAVSFETIELVRTGLAALTAPRRHYDETIDRCTHLAGTACEGRGQTCMETRRERCLETFGLDDEHPPPALATYFIHARFSALDDEVLRRRLAGIPTTLELPAESLDLLIQSAPAVLESADDLHRLVADLGGTL